MNRELARAVRDRAREHCEYCRIPQFTLPLPFQVDHIIAEQHGGESVLDNLALACPHCNRYKGPNIAGLDPASGELVRLFHPRTDLWVGHLQSDGPRITGRTAIGRVTVHVLAMNAPDLLRFRVQLMAKESLSYKGTTRIGRATALIRSDERVLLPEHIRPKLLMPLIQAGPCGHEPD